MKRVHLVTVLRVLLFILWAALIVGLYVFIHTQNIPLRHVPKLLRAEVVEAGPWGPLVIIGLYLASTLLLFTKAGIDIISGAVYGPVIGSIFVLVGLNLAASATFYFGRFFGRHFVHAHEHGWIKKYDDLLAQEGFITVFLMRLLLFPFDLVSIGCGMSKMQFRQYFFGTLLGSLPGTVTFVVLGQAFMEPRAWVLFGALLVVSLLFVLILRRSEWAKKKLLKTEP